MISKLLKSIFGSRNDRIVNALKKDVLKINALEPAIQALSDAQLQDKTAEFKARLQQGEKLNDILPEAFAVVRETSRRTLGLRHFDVQLIGGMVMHHGKIAEMRTGEGKTLMATLAAYLNALTGRGVHLVTVNDYLAKRDAEWMGPIYRFLGLTVGVNLPSMGPSEKQEAYGSDITYGTNNEFGFDYLRDNMAFSLESRTQRSLHFAIIDEVDSILVDEARTPLIISGQGEASSDLYTKITNLIPQLTLQKMTEEQKEEEVPEEDRGDYIVDEKNHQAMLTEQGHQKIEALLEQAGLLKKGASLYDVHHIHLMHYINACLRAHSLYHRDVAYVVKDDQVIIVDEHTGRLMDGRRWSEGLHQAIEAKENVPIQLENQTLATITLQNYFRMYEKLAGMTGTADTEAYEFQKIYGLEVVVIPTNRPMIRDDRSDQIYMGQKGKFKAVVKEIQECRDRGQPVLVGTASIENSELLSKLLQKEKITHQVLNAKQHEREAKIIAEAGRPGVVTIATNMAGRGTDIVLGGNLESELTQLANPTPEEVEQHRADWQKRHDSVLQAGGLHVLGTERHESRRIDNQLRGRSGRQGDPGSSQFYLSMEDNLMRIFAGDRMKNLMVRIGMNEDEAVQHPIVSRSIERAQRRVESLNFDIRKQLLEYDDVANDQRKVIYQQRLELLKSENISSTILGIREEVFEDLIAQYIPKQSMEEEWNVTGLEQQIAQDFHVKLNIQQWLEQDDSLHEETLLQKISDEMGKVYEQKIANVDAQVVHNAEKSIMLQALDSHWRDHLAAMDQLRKGIHLRGYAQKNPIQEYKRESFDMFTTMLNNIKYEVIATLTKIEFIETDENGNRISAQEQLLTISPLSMGGNLQFQHAQIANWAEAEPTLAEVVDGVEVPAASLSEYSGSEGSGGVAEVQPYVRQTPKVGRNEPCPCGSGKKYKQCHGQLV